MQVYIEYVFMDNLVIDYLLLKSTFLILGRTVKRNRLILSAVIGAVIALLYPLLDGVKLISLSVKILSGFLILLTANKYQTARQFYLAVLLFFTLTFLTGGAIIGVYSLLEIPYSNEVSIALIIIPVYLILGGVVRLIKYMYRQKTVQSLCYDLELTLNDSTVKARGFLDTGNALFDGDNPVIVIDKNLAKRLLGDFRGVKIHKITVNTVSGTSQKLAFKIDRIKIYKLNGVNIYNSVTVCVSDAFLGDGYDLILHPYFMEDRTYELNATEIKEVS